MFNLEKEIGQVKVEDAIVFGGLAVYPLLRETSKSHNYVTLTEALRKEGVEITEVSEGGSVPQLLLKNLLDEDVFAADGEALIGAKQNRVLNSTLFINAKSEVVIPVSCVERGRWSYRRRHFRASKYSEFVSSRAAKMASVSESLRRADYKRAANQGEVWRQMDAKREYFQADAPTGSMSDIYEAERPTLDRYARIFRPKSDQVGLACAIDGRIAGVELFETADIYKQYAGKLVRAYASEVLGEVDTGTVAPSRTTLQEFLHKVSTQRADEYPAVGNGTELRISGGGLDGSALVIEDRLLHLVVFTDASRRMH